MQPRQGFCPLLGGQLIPMSGALGVLPRRHPAGAGRHPVQDRPIQVVVDDLVVRHGRPLLNTPNLSQTDVQVTFDREPILNGNDR